MDIHTRIVACLYIVYGLVGAVFIGLGALALGGIAHFVPAMPIPAYLQAFGAVMFAVIALLCLAQAIAGFAVLKGRRAGRGFLIAFAILGLFNKPWGTLLGIYTLWALLRKRPATTVEAA